MKAGQPHAAVGHHGIDQQEGEHGEEERQAAQQQIADTEQAVSREQPERENVGGDGDAGTDEHGAQGQIIQYMANAWAKGRLRVDRQM